jgi:hypothetical protein
VPIVRRSLGENRQGSKSRRQGQEGWPILARATVDRATPSSDLVAGGVLERMLRPEFYRLCSGGGVKHRPSPSGSSSDSMRLFFPEVPAGHGRCRVVAIEHALFPTARNEVQLILCGLAVEIGPMLNAAPHGS